MMPVIQGNATMAKRKRNQCSRSLSSRIFAYLPFIFVLCTLSFLLIRTNLPRIISHRILPYVPRTFVDTAPYFPIQSPPLFTKPQLIAAGFRHNGAIISMFTAGIGMQESQRNLSAVACRLGSRVVSALSFANDVLHCPVESIQPGDSLAPVLARDHVLKHALLGPVHLPTGVVAELSENDLRSLDGLTLAPGLHSKELAMVPSTHVHDPAPSPREWRWQVCLMTQIKPTAYHLPDWVDYHRRIGVDHVFIFDNGASEDIDAMFAGRPDVEVIHWPYHKVQLQLVGYFLLVARDLCEHVLHMDVDEFYMFGLGTEKQFAAEPPLPRYIRRARQNGFTSFRLPYITMTNSGYRLRPKGPIPENYLHKNHRQFFENGKSTCATDVDYESGLVHGCGVVQGKKHGFYCQRPQEWGDINMEPKEIDDPGFVVHFRKRSWEEWVERMDAGWVVGALVGDSMKGKLDINKPPEKFLAVNNSMRYTHFRDVYRRVITEGRLDRAYLVRRQTSGRRCIGVMDMKRPYLPPQSERCLST